MSEKPSVLERISSAVTVSSIASLIEPLSPAAKMVTKETSASPIISAAAVVAVRPGLRTAFSRAIRPETPRSRSSGRPTTEAIGRDQPRAQQGDAEEDERRRRPRPRPRPGRGRRRARARIRAIPSTVSAAPASAAAGARPLSVSSTAPSRRPATGGTLVARSAGISAAEAG